MPSYRIHPIGNGTPCTLLEWQKKHKNCPNRIHKLIYSGENCIDGKIYYSTLICFDCSTLFIIDRVLVEFEETRNII